MDIKEQRDKVIKEKFQNDKIISAPTLYTYDNYINDSKIKQKKYTKKQKNILFFILILSILLNIYLLLKDNNLDINLMLSKKSMESNTLNNNLIINNNTSDNNVDNNTINNNISNNYFENENNIINTTISNTTISASTKTEVSDSEFNSEEFKKLIELYSLGIHRVSDTNPDEKEKNSVLLTVGMKYFNFCASSKKNNDSISNFSTKYATTTENLHLFLSELTKKQYTSEVLPTYEDYIKYNFNSKSYSYGSNSSYLTSEIYEVLDLKTYTPTNDIYTVEANIKRIAKYNNDINLEDTFKVTFKVKLNSNYTYTKYKIMSMYFENVDNKAPNRTFNLVDTSMFSKQNLDEINKKILSSSNDVSTFIFFDDIKTTSKNKYTISYRKIIENEDSSFETFEEKLVITKEDDKLRIE